MRRSETVTSARDGGVSPSPFRNALASCLAFRSAARSLPAPFQRVDHRLLVGERGELLERPLGLRGLDFRHDGSPVSRGHLRQVALARRARPVSVGGAGCVSTAIG
jgi:hypothetical protein